MTAPFRIEPNMGPGSYRTYQIRQPRTSHTRLGSCESAGCKNWAYGWKTTVPSLSPAADYIRNKAGRHFKEIVEDGMSVFTFYPGQQCFAEHHVTDRPQFFVVRDGDFRGNPSGRQRQHTQGSYWVEDFQENQQRLADRLEKG